MMLKILFNKRWPFWRRCLMPGCWHGQTNQSHCHRHQQW